MYKSVHFACNAYKSVHFACNVYKSLHFACNVHGFGQLLGSGEGQAGNEWFLLRLHHNPRGLWAFSSSHQEGSSPGALQEEPPRGRGAACGRAAPAAPRPAPGGARNSARPAPLCTTPLYKANYRPPAFPTSLPSPTSRLPAAPPYPGTSRSASPTRGRPRGRAGRRGGGGGGGGGSIPIPIPIPMPCSARPGRAHLLKSKGMVLVEGAGLSCGPPAPALAPLPPAARPRKCRPRRRAAPTHWAARPGRRFRRRVNGHRGGDGSGCAHRVRRKPPRWAGGAPGSGSGPQP